MQASPKKSSVTKSWTLPQKPSSASQNLRKVSQNAFGRIHRPPPPGARAVRYNELHLNLCHRQIRKPLFSPSVPLPSSSKLCIDNDQNCVLRSSFRGDLIKDQVPEWASWQEAAESQGRCWEFSRVSSLKTRWTVGHLHWEVKITLVVQVLPTRQLKKTVWWHLYRIMCNPEADSEMTSPSVVVYGWWAVPGRTREGEAIPLEGWQESLRGAEMSPKIVWVAARAWTRDWVCTLYL